MLSQSILIVDDEPDVRMQFREILNQYYSEVMEADNGLVALEILRSHPVAVTITDIRMPEMGGLELCEKIRSESLCHNILTLTGYSSREDVKKALNLGATGLLDKPVDEDDLIRTVEGMMNRLGFETYLKNILGTLNRYSLIEKGADDFDLSDLENQINLLRERLEEDLSHRKGLPKLRDLITIATLNSRAMKREFPNHPNIEKIYDLLDEIGNIVRPNIWHY